MKSLSIICFSLLVLTVFTCNCSSISGDDFDSTYVDYSFKKVPYNFTRPDATYYLDYQLEEISGLSLVNGSFWAIEDENGYLYELDGEDARLKRRIKFEKDGDYEAVEVVGNTAYVAKSNGDIYAFIITADDEITSQETDTDFSSSNNIEGLCAYNNKLLIACKGKGEIDDDDVKGKAVYLYDPAERKVNKKPLFNYDEDDIDEFIEDRKYFNNVKSFDPSGIAVHPITGDIYWLSADEVMLVIDKNYDIKEVVPLDKHIYRQPEGLCFDTDGTLYLSSEAAGASPKIFKINYRPE